MEVEVRCLLSNLPDEILGHILSFLSLRNIARLRVLSKRFQTLCTSAPSFSIFDRGLHYSPRCSCLHVLNFMNTLPQLRPHALKIDKLSFVSTCERDEHHSLHEQWINKLFQTFHVDELDLNYQLHSISKSLSRFQSLKVLKLEMMSNVSVKLPEMKLASLETLYMIFIKTEDLVGEWVSQSFPSLKSLLLSNIMEARVSTKQLYLAIRSSCLEDLSIQHCCAFKVVRIITENLRALSYGICWSRDCGHVSNVANKFDEIVVEISAPNLQSLSWKGAPAKLYYNARTMFKSLHVAIITNFKIENLNLNLLTQLFKAVRWARFLHIDSGALKFMNAKIFW